MEPILSLESISKSFYGVQVLFDVNLQLFKGEVLGLVGENGAGKSTLMNVIGGVLKSDGGAMTLGGKSYTPDNPKKATDMGISFIHQELSLFTNLTVAENVFIDSFPRGFLGRIRNKEILKKTREFLDKYKLEGCEPNTVVGDAADGDAPDDRDHEGAREGYQDIDIRRTHDFFVHSRKGSAFSRPSFR